MQNPFESPASRSELRPSTAAQIEDYLDHLCAPLIDRTTYEQRLAIRDEVRAHLLVLAASHAELGSSSTEALQAAMEQFGEPNKIGRSLSREYPKPFTPNGPMLWSLFHGVMGGVVGSVAVVAVNCLLYSRLRLQIGPLPINCLIGFGIGYLPGVKLLKRPAAPLPAAVRTGGYYLATTAALMTLLIVLEGGGHLGDPKYLAMIRTIVLGMGFNGLIGGAVMSPLFQRLRQFAPRSKSQIAR